MPRSTHVVYSIFTRSCILLKCIQEAKRRTFAVEAAPGDCCLQGSVKMDSSALYLRHETLNIGDE